MLNTVESAEDSEFSAILSSQTFLSGLWITYVSSRRDELSEAEEALEAETEKREQRAARRRVRFGF